MYSTSKQGCRLLFATHIGHNVIRKEERKRKMCSKKWYLKRNISCYAHLLNELLETDVPWDDAIVVSAGKLRTTVGFPEWTAQFCVCKTTEKDISEACATACQNCVVYSVCPSVMTSHSNIAKFSWEWIGRLTLKRRVKSHLPFASVIKSSPYSPR